jgi:MSHA pilin protein MshA
MYAWSLENMVKQSGFTLIELVLVIVILAILSAVAVPKFLSVRSDAQQSAMEGLKGALESASTLVNAKAEIEGLGSFDDEDLSSGIRVHWGYPFATQKNLRLVLDFSENIDWELTGSSPVIFTFLSDSDDMSATDIKEDESLCKLTYNQALKGERPVISITGCTD